MSAPEQQPGHGGGGVAILAALGANLGIAVMKFLAFLLTSSSSMLAESIHSLADSGNQLLLLVGGKRARKEADERHPFGYGRERYVFAFIVSVVLFSVGGLFSLYEASHKFTHPEAIESWKWVPVAVLVGATVMESLSLRTAVHESATSRGSQSWLQFIRTAKAPELPVVLLEDVAALCGLLFALFGVVLTLLTDDGRWDAVGTAMIGVLLVAVAVVLAVETKSLLLGESASASDVAAIQRALGSAPRVERIIHMRTLHLGPDELLVAAKIAVSHDNTAAQVAATIDEAERAIRSAVPIARVIYLEPDVWSDETARRGADLPPVPGGAAH